jgi:hypothetical protein
MTPPILRAVLDLECPDCALSIHAGDDVVLGERGWVHPCCGELEGAPV